MRSIRLAGLAIALFGWTVAAAQGPNAVAPNCSNWTLDGYRLGMRGDELLAIRSVTLHVAGQAQVTEPGKLHGVLVMDPANLLVKWEVRYYAESGERLRAEMRTRFGGWISDVSGELLGDPSDSIRQRRTIWQSAGCDAVIIVYENTSAHGSPKQSVSATLARGSMLPKGLAEMKTLFH